MSEELKQNLQNVSAQLQQLASTKATIQKLVENGSVRVVDATTKEGEEPLVLSIGSSEMIDAMLAPVDREVSLRKERALNAKEALLRALEQELTGDTEAPAESTVEAEESEKQPG